MPLPRLRRAVLPLVGAVVLAMPGAALARTLAPPAVTPEPIDCTGPAGDPSPGTAAWHARELREAYCGEQRVADTAANPAFHASAAEMLLRDGAPVAQDPFRDPEALNGHRFRYERVTFSDPSGNPLDGRLLRPCDAGSCPDLPAGLRTFAPPYPAVIVVHGGGAMQEMYWWGTEALAEAGYMVLTFQVPLAENTGGSRGHYADAKAALDFLTATPHQPTASDAFNPRWKELDRERIGLAGHSAGGVAVSRLGQEDSRVSAIVSWDRAQSSPMPEDLSIRIPALFLAADYNCQSVPVCLPQPYTEPPDPLGPGNKGEDFRRLQDAGVDTMKVVLRAATHLDFTQFAPAGTGSRYGAAVSAYYTLAWFDRYLRGTAPAGAQIRHDALRRLTGPTFDDSGDVHSISGGTWDPVTRENVPPRLAGMPVADRLSFHFRSAYSLKGGALTCVDMRAGCG